MIIIGKYNPSGNEYTHWTWEPPIGTIHNPYPNNYEVSMKHMSGKERFKLPELPINVFRFIIATHYTSNGKTFCCEGHPLVVSGKAR